MTLFETTQRLSLGACIMSCRSLRDGLNAQALLPPTAHMSVTTPVSSHVTPVQPRPQWSLPFQSSSTVSPFANEALNSSSSSVSVAPELGWAR